MKRIRDCSYKIYLATGGAKAGPAGQVVGLLLLPAAATLDATVQEHEHAKRSLRKSMSMS